MSLFEFPAKEPQVAHYELLVLVLGRFTEDQASGIFTEITTLIGELGGTVTQNTSLGRRPLAYRVDGERNGSYQAIEFDADRSKVAALHEKLRIRKDVARFMIVKKTVRAAEEIAKYEALRAQLLATREKALAEAAAAAAASPAPISASLAAPAVAAASEGVGPAAPAAAPELTPVTESEPEPEPEPLVIDEPIIPPVSKSSSEAVNQQIDKLLSDDVEV